MRIVFARSIDWSVYAPNKAVKIKAKKEPREHQITALDEVKKGLATADRGKLIMACGTGKTFTGLKIAETLVGVGKHVLFLVPSLSLMSQTITEWTIESATPLRSFAVCSDNQVGKRKNGDDLADINIHDLAYPATTDAKKLAVKIAHPHNCEMTVIFPPINPSKSYRKRKKSMAYQPLIRLSAMRRTVLQAQRLSVRMNQILSGFTTKPI